MTVAPVQHDVLRHVSNAAPACASCAHFVSDPRLIEAHLPGFNALSSASASVRGDDGLCLRHQRLLGAASLCADYLGKAALKFSSPQPA